MIVHWHPSDGACKACRSTRSSIATRESGRLRGRCDPRSESPSASVGKSALGWACRRENPSKVALLSRQLFDPIMNELYAEVIDHARTDMRHAAEPGQGHALVDHGQFRRR